MPIVHVNITIFIGIGNGKFLSVQVAIIPFADKAYIPDEIDGTSCFRDGPIKATKPNLDRIKKYIKETPHIDTYSLFLTKALTEVRRYLKDSLRGGKCCLRLRNI